MKRSFTVIRSSVNRKGGIYLGENVQTIAKYIASEFLARSKKKKVSFTIKETTKNSKKSKYLINAHYKNENIHIIRKKIGGMVTESHLNGKQFYLQSQNGDFLRKTHTGSPMTFTKQINNATIWYAKQFNLKTNPNIKVYELLSKDKLSVSVWFNIEDNYNHTYMYTLFYHDRGIFYPYNMIHKKILEDNIRLKMIPISG